MRGPAVLKVAPKQAVPTTCSGASIITGCVIPCAAGGNSAAPSGHFLFILRTTAGIVRYSAVMVSRTGGIFMSCGVVADTPSPPTLRRAGVTLADPGFFLEVKLAGHLAVPCARGGAAHPWIMRVISQGDSRHHRDDNGRTDKRATIFPPQCCSSA